MKHVVVVGSSNTDMVVKLPRLPVPGETVLGGDFTEVAGGKGANQAVAAARLGAAVTLIARVGDDAYGSGSVSGFRQAGIETRWIARDGRFASGIALIMVDSLGENMIAVASGANSALSVGDLENAEEAFHGAGVVLTQLETPLPVVGRAGEVARGRGAHFILNPAPAALLDDSLMELVTVLTPNEGEASVLSGIEIVNPETAILAARRLRERGPRVVVITLGSAGALLVDQDGEILIPARSVKAVDTTAAGDAFNGALACALCEEMPLRRAVEFANRVAAISVTRMGAQSSLPTRAEVESAL